MRNEVGVQAEAFLAAQTFVWPFARVRPPMNNQARSLAKALPTVQALVWFFAGVDSLVPDKS